MQWFYFIPFKLKSDAERKSTPPVVEYEPANIALYIAVGVITLAMFFAFIVMPAILALRAAIPAQ